MSLSVPFNFGRGNGKHWDLRRYVNNVAALASGNLRVTSSVVAAETVTIGKDIFAIEIVNTAITPTLPKTLPANAVDVSFALTGVTMVVGDLLRCASEIFRVKQVQPSGAGVVNYVFHRADSGTSAASHTVGDALLTAAVPGATVAAGKIPVGLVTTLTNTAFTTAFVAVVNYTNENQVYPIITAFNAATGVTFVVAKNRGVNAFATTETLSNGAWDDTTLKGGVDPARLLSLHGSHVPSAAEVTEGTIRIPYHFDATPAGWIVQVRDTNGVVKAWDGVAAAVAPASTGFPSTSYNPSYRKPGYMTLDNSGSTDWAATDTIYYVIFE